MWDADNSEAVLWNAAHGPEVYGPELHDMLVLEQYKLCVRLCANRDRKLRRIELPERVKMYGWRQTPVWSVAGGQADQLRQTADVRP